MKKKLAILSILALYSTVFLAGCKKTEEIITIQEGDTVTFSYNSYLLNGEIIEENSIQTITIGENESFPIFDKELIGLKSGDTKEFTTKDPKEGYGIAYDDVKIQEFTNTVIDEIWKTLNRNIEDLRVGEQVNIGSMNGEIVEVSPFAVKIDFNEKYTRENAEFHVTIITIEKNTTEQ